MAADALYELEMARAQLDALRTARAPARDIRVMEAQVRHWLSIVEAELRFE